MKHISLIGWLLKDTAQGWSEHRAQSQGAALAFYSPLAIAPLTIIAFAVAGSLFGEEAARGGIVDQIKLGGPDCSSIAR